MAVLKYWDAGSNSYLQVQNLATYPPSNILGTVLTAPTVAASPYTIAHNMNTTNVMVQAWDVVTGDLIIVRSHISDANHIQVFFEQNAPNNVNVLVLGAGGSLQPAPVVAARMYYGGTAQHLTAGTWATLIFDTVEYDTHAACAPSTGTYTVPVGQGGDYLVTGHCGTGNLTGGQAFIIQVIKNGTSYAVGTEVPASAGVGTSVLSSSVVRCNPGDTLQVQAYAQAACDLYANSGSQYMTVHRIFPGLQGGGAFFPTQVPPPTGFNSYTDPSGEAWVSRNGSAWARARTALHAQVSRNAAYTVPTAAAILPFDTVTFDTFALFNFTSYGFVIPVAGYYSLHAQVLVNAPVNQQYVFYLLQNGTVVYATQPTVYTGALYIAAQITVTKPFSTGDLLQIQNWMTASAGSLAGGPPYLFFQIDYVGHQ
jgi:hypothetical protein